MSKEIKKDENLIISFISSSLVGGLSYKFVFLNFFHLSTLIALVISTFVDMLIFALILDKTRLTKNYIVLSLFVSFILGYFTYIFVL